jgi:hypothetical protein
MTYPIQGWVFLAVNQTWKITMKKNYYNARWGQAGKPSVANVSFYASHDANAIKQADKLGRQLGVSNTPRTIFCENRIVK